MARRNDAISINGIPILPEQDDSPTFRGAGMGKLLDPNDPIDPLHEYIMASWFMVGDREYPPFYYHTMSKYRAHPADVERMRSALRGLPRVDVRDYDILFNGFVRCWEIVKWVPQPAAPRWIPGLGNVLFVIRMPIDVLTLDFGRSPISLGERDWTWLRRNCSTLRDPGLIDAEMVAYNEEIKRNLEHQQRDELEDELKYYHKGIRREAEESGIAYATPAQMAKVFGGESWMYDPDYHDEED